VKRTTFAIALAFLLCPRASILRAQADAPLANPWYEQITLNGLVEVSYGYNFNRPDSGLNQYRVFDFDDNSFELEMLEIVAQKGVTIPGDAGFRFDLAFGSAVPRVAASFGLFRDRATGEAGDLDLHQGYVSYIAKLGRGLRLDAGKFVTHFGYEVIDGYDGYNDNATRSFLFGYAIPFTHTGLRAAYPIAAGISGTLMLVNGWDNAVDNNAAKSGCFQLAFAPDPKWSACFNWMGGAEQQGNDHDKRFLYELIATVKPSGRLTLGLDGLYGNEQQVLGPGRDAKWRAAAAYLRVGIGRGFGVCVRGEMLDDRDGSRTGHEQELKEITLTPEYKTLTGFAVRADLRVDWSDQSVFLKRSALTVRQPTVFVSALYTF
jgi:hypothetical protein